MTLSVGWAFGFSKCILFAEFKAFGVSLKTTIALHPVKKNVNQSTGLTDDGVTTGNQCSPKCQPSLFPFADTQGWPAFGNIKC